MSQTARTTEVLNLLLKSASPRSGQEIGDLLGCSRAAIGKAVASLREQGFVIEAKSRTGYVLASEPDLVLPARVEARLEPASLGRPVIHFAEIDSTNREARRRAEQGATHGSCLVAEFQSKGRGRLERTWTAPPGACLLFSMLLKPELSLEEVFSITNLTALACCRALEAVCGVTPLIKWPNDLFWEGRKLAGILTEFTSRAERVEYAVVGVGLNVNLDQGELDTLPGPGASSLQQASGKRQDRAVVLAAILNEFSKAYERFCAGDRDELTGEYQFRSMLLGRMVTVRDGKKEIKGLAKAVDAVGALILETEDGGTTVIRHGDVSVLKM